MDMQALLWFVHECIHLSLDFRFLPLKYTDKTKHLVSPLKYTDKTK